MTTSLLEAALALAALGKPIFPCWNCPEDEDKHKAPMVKGGHIAATTKESFIKRWWGKWPDALIGMPTGPASGIAVLDIDVKKGKNGYTFVPDWKMRSHVIAKTQSGGAHVYFSSEGAPRNTSDNIFPGVDTRGEGGYVIVPPSPGYTWLNGSDLSGLPPFPADLAARLPDRSSSRTPGAEPEADLLRIAAALEVTPNDNLGWEEWNRVGMAVWAATIGDETGFEAFDKWSAKSDKYYGRTTRKRWDHYFGSPPTSIGAGTLFYMAKEADPDWERNFENAIVQRFNSTDADSATLNWIKNREPAMPVGASEEEPAISDATPEEEGPTSDVDEAPSVDIKEPSPKAADVPPKPPAKSSFRIISSGEFVGSFVPPDYLIDGVIQKRFIYSMTAQTNIGKTTVALYLAALVALGLPLGDKEIEKGKVLFFAGENPDDVRMRWIGLADKMKFDQSTDQVFWVAGTFSISKMRSVIDAQTKRFGPFALIIIDSAAAYFEGKEENSNTELGNYARMLRTLVDVNGGPCVLVLAHPIKNANADSLLLPRGGGAFLNEVDGNLVLIPKAEAPKVVEMHWHGKIRGPDFQPISFAIEPTACDQLKDSKGRKIWTVAARLLSPKEREVIEDQGQLNRNKLLCAMKAKEGASITELAKQCGWFFKSGEPNKPLVQRRLKELEGQRLVEKKGDHYKLTKAGREAAEEAAKL